MTSVRVRKHHAIAIAVTGIVTFALAMYLIYWIFATTREINSQPNPPPAVLFFQQVPICNCDMSTTLIWNIVAGFMLMSAVATVSSIGVYRLATRKGY